MLASDHFIRNTFIIAGAVVGTAMLFWLGVVFLGMPPTGGKDDVIVHIPLGATFEEIGSQLIQLRLIDDRQTFATAARLLGLERSLHAGRYRLRRGMTLLGVLRVLKSGNSEPVAVTVIEGLQARQIAERLEESLDIDADKFMLMIDSTQFAGELGVDEGSLEGYLFPDTYHFAWPASEGSVIRQMVAEFWKHVDASARRRAKVKGMSVHEIVTLASIIEGEAIHDEERPVISAVYWNRLASGMRLQADPTIQYIIPDGPRRLLTRDLQIDSPYNTYLHYGLPPGPINNPGAASIGAALYPADVSYLYFVARGDGYHRFSTTGSEHAEAKRQFQRVRREVARSRRSQ